MTTIEPLAKLETTTCDQCGFSLWLPIMDLRSARLGLYDDARFPGRCILSLNQHYDLMEDVPAATFHQFMSDVQLVQVAIRIATGCDRVNLAVLGNRERHVHAHLIPRVSASEPFPEDSPWRDSRKLSVMPVSQREVTMSKISRALEKLIAS